MGVVTVDDDCGAGVVPQATPKRIHADDATSVAKICVRMRPLYSVSRRSVKRFVHESNAAKTDDAERSIC